MEITISVSEKIDERISYDGAIVSLEQWHSKTITKEEREFIRRQMKECFKEIFDMGEPRVVFDDEED